MNKKVLNKLALIVGTDETKLEAVLLDEAADLEVSGELFSQTELVARDKANYERGKEAGPQMLVKSLATKYSLSEVKDIEGLIEGYAAKKVADTNKSADEKDVIIKNLQNNISEYEVKTQTLSGTVDRLKLESELSTKMPKLTIDGRFFHGLLNTDGISLSKNDAGEIVVKKGTEVVRDQKTQNPVDVATFLKTYAKEQNILAPEDAPAVGRGKDKAIAGIGAKTMQEVTAELDARGIVRGSQEYMAAVSAAVKANKDIV